MSTAENPEQVKAVQENWDQREFVEVVSIHILQITEFLNNFEKTTRQRMAEIGKSMTSLERRLEYVEAAMKTAANR